MHHAHGRRVRRKTRNLAKKVASRFGWGLHRLTDAGEMQRLISRLRPLDVGLDLIRVGGPHDGGYLVPDDLEGISACFSPGVGTNTSFEEDLMWRGIPSFLADASVDGPPGSLFGAHFVKKFLAGVSSDTTITLEEWVAAHQPDPAGTLLLQMDIEGAEYECLLSTPSDTLRRFRIIVIELHHLRQIGHPPFFWMLRAVVEKLLADFDVVHIHPNNASRIHDLAGVLTPGVIEMTLLRKDRGGPRRPARLPHPLDAPNMPSKADMSLPPNWA